MSPCIVDTSFEDKKWNHAIACHHQRVEALLVSVLDGNLATESARDALKAERKRLAGEYRAVYGGLRNAGSVALGMAQIERGEIP